MRKTYAYTVFQDEACRIPRRNTLGHIVFTRRLVAARSAARPGDVIQGWRSNGSPSTLWKVGLDGRMRVVR